MPPLRASQVETLRLVRKLEDSGEEAGVQPWRLAAALGITVTSAKRRVERLRGTRHLYAFLALSEDLTHLGNYYRNAFRLTQLGREALEGEG